MVIKIRQWICQLSKIQIKIVTVGGHIPPWQRKTWFVNIFSYKDGRKEYHASMFKVVYNWIWLDSIHCAYTF